VEEVAHGIHEIANARMTRALRAVSSERGRDPRDFALVAFGGAGPLHAAGLAEELGITTVLVPPLAGLFSAIGLLFARLEFHDVRPFYADARTVDADDVARLYGEMERGLQAALRHVERLEWVRSAELRYEGQSWEVEVELPPGPVSRATLTALVARFEDEHERLYGVRGQPGSAVQLRALRLAALGPEQPGNGLVPEGAARVASEATRVALFDGRPISTPVLTRNAIGTKPQPGPILVDEYDTTVVVRPRWTVRRDLTTSTLILERERR
jgi:N-methylhydantoinase A